MPVMMTASRQLFFKRARGHPRVRYVLATHPPVVSHSLGGRMTQMAARCKFLTFVPLPRAMRVEDALPARGTRGCLARASQACLPPAASVSPVSASLEAATEQQVWQFRHFYIALLDRLQIYSK